MYLRENASTPWCLKAYFLFCHGESMFGLKRVQSLNTGNRFQVHLGNGHIIIILCKLYYM